MMLPAQLPGNLPGPSGDLPGLSVFNIPEYHALPATFRFLPVPLRHTVISYLGKQDAWKLSNPDVLFLVLFWGEHQKIKKKLPAQLPEKLPGPSGDLPECSVFVYKKSEEKASGIASGKPSGSFR